jgi:hypothetical protein
VNYSVIDLIPCRIPSVFRATQQLLYIRCELTALGVFAATWARFEYYALPEPMSNNISVMTMAVIIHLLVAACCVNWLTDQARAGLAHG